MTVFHVTARPATIHDQTLVFTWDSDTGAVSGPDADWVLDRARQLAGKVVGLHPLPMAYTLTDPLHDPEQMAVMIGEYHVLPDELKAFYPRMDADEASDVEVQY